MSSPTSRHAVANGIYHYVGDKSCDRILISEDLHITAIGKRAFDGCVNIKRINIPYGVISIGDAAFFGCKALQSVTFPCTLRTIGKHVFCSCRELESVTIDENVTYIGSTAFMLCSELTILKLPSALTLIEDETFSGCSRLQIIKIPKGVTAVGNKAFSYCTSLKTISVPEACISIGEDAFSNCMNLTAVYVYNEVKYSGHYFKCERMKDIYLKQRKDIFGLSSVDIIKAVHQWGGGSYKRITLHTIDEYIIEKLEFVLCVLDNSNDELVAHQLEVWPEYISALTCTYLLNIS